MSTISTATHTAASNAAASKTAAHYVTGSRLPTRRPASISPAGQWTMATHPAAPTHDLPGGGQITERWVSPHRVLLAVTGELDVYDEHRVLDVLSGCVLVGARNIDIDFGATSFVGLATLKSALRVRTFLASECGELTVRGLRPALAELWEAMAASTTRGNSDRRPEPLPMSPPLLKEFP